MKGLKDKVVIVSGGAINGASSGIAGSLDGLLQLGDLFVVHSRSFLDLDGLRRFTLRSSRRTAGISHHLVVFNFR